MQTEQGGELGLKHNSPAAVLVTRSPCFFLDLAQKVNWLSRCKMLPVSVAE